LKWLYSNIFSPSISTTNTFNANAGKVFKGGSQKMRDAEIQQYPSEFQKWYHRFIKGNQRGDASSEELKELYQEWKNIGRPNVK